MLQSLVAASLVPSHGPGLGCLLTLIVKFSKKIFVAVFFQSLKKNSDHLLVYLSENFKTCLESLRKRKNAAIFFCDIFHPTGCESSRQFVPRLL